MDNNEARRKFKAFVSEWGLEVSGCRNVFKDSGQLWAFVADPAATSLRQFYEDCAGVYKNGEFVDKKNLHISSVSRVSPNGVKAYSVRFCA